MSLPDLKNDLIQKIQNSEDQALLIQIAGWMAAVEDEPRLRLNEAQKSKIDASRRQIKEGNFRQQDDLFASFENG